MKKKNDLILSSVISCSLGFCKQNNIRLFGQVLYYYNIKFICLKLEAVLLLQQGKQFFFNFLLLF